MAFSDIGWCSYTLNLHAGCLMVDAACRNCYAQRMANRLAAMGQEKYQGLTRKTADNKAVWSGQYNNATDDFFTWPFREQTPHLVFVDSMADFFLEAISDADFLRAWGALALARQHTFMVLSKRPEHGLEQIRRFHLEIPAHIWIGASVAEKARVHRLDTLREFPARIRFLSVEPLIEDLGPLDLTDIHLVIAGGESGPGHRPYQVQWARSLREQCREQGVAFYHKQYGHASNNPLYRDHGAVVGRQLEIDMAREQGFDIPPDPRHWPSGGCSIDGRFHFEMPEPGRSLLSNHGKPAQAAPGWIDTTWKRQQIDADLAAGRISRGTAARLKQLVTLGRV